MKHLKLIYTLFFFLGLFSVQTSEETLNNFKDVSISQEGLLRVSEDSKVNFLFNELTTPLEFAVKGGRKVVAPVAKLMQKGFTVAANGAVKMGNQILFKIDIGTTKGYFIIKSFVKSMDANFSEVLAITTPEGFVMKMDGTNDTFDNQVLKIIKDTQGNYKVLIEELDALVKLAEDLKRTFGISDINKAKRIAEKLGADKVNKVIQKADVIKTADKDVIKLLDDLAYSPDLANNIDGFTNELVEAWRRANDLFPSGSKFITDLPTLEKISKLASEGSAFRTKLGSNWSEALDEILKNANDLKCSSCGNAGRVGRSSMDQYLDDVDYFISNFNIGSGGKGEVFFNWMRGTTKNGSVPTSNQLDELHQTIRDLSKREIKETNVRGLGQAFDVGKPGAALKEYDLRQVNNVYTEYKNVDFASNPLINQQQSIDQFINGYLRNIESFDKLEWKAGFDKLKSAWATEANALSKMKSQWKSVFENKADEIFEVIWDNQNLRNSLFESGLEKADVKPDFLDMISDTNDSFFNFIKIE